MPNMIAPTKAGTSRNSSLLQNPGSILLKIMSPFLNSGKCASCWVKRMTTSFEVEYLSLPTQLALLFSALRVFGAARSGNLATLCAVGIFSISRVAKKVPETYYR